MGNLSGSSDIAGLRNTSTGSLAVAVVLRTVTNVRAGSSASQNVQIVRLACSRKIKFASSALRASLCDRRTKITMSVSHAASKQSIVSTVK